MAHPRLSICAAWGGQISLPFGNLSGFTPKYDPVRHKRTRMVDGFMLMAAANCSVVQPGAAGLGV